MLTSPLNIEELDTCQELLQRAKGRKHPSLKHDEFADLRSRYRAAHWCPEDKPSGFFGRWGYSLVVNKLADPALDEYLRRHGIVVLPAPASQPLHPYESAGTSGVATIADIERKAKLARKLEELQQRIKGKPDGA